MSKVVVMDHPIIKHKLTYLRRDETDQWLFRYLIKDITCLMVYECTKDIKAKPIEIQTPLAKCPCEIMDEEIILVPILRAGLGMLDSFLSLLPTSKVGFLGMYRDEETLEPVEYYCKVSTLADAQVFIIDPMLATAGSAIAAVDNLKNRGATKLRFVRILASPEGVERLSKAHPDVDIYCAHIDDCLDENGFIIPGIGDCGDRIFWTE